MTRDLLILPAGSAESQTAAAELYRRMNDSVVQPDGSHSEAARVIEVVDRLNLEVGTGDDGFLAVAVEPDGRGAVVCIREPLLDEALLVVLEETMDKDLAVYDVTTDRLYDPRARVPVRVTVGDGTTLPYLTEALTRELLDTGDSRGAYLIAQHPGRYLHAVRGAAGRYDLESRVDQVIDESAGVDDVHRTLGSVHHALSAGTADSASAAVWRWVRGGDWHTAADWRSIG